MHALKTNHQAKFCENCHVIIALEDKPDAPKHCDDCGPYERIVADSNAQIDMLNDRREDARKTLGRLRDARTKAIREATLRN